MPSIASPFDKILQMRITKSKHVAEIKKKIIKIKIFSSIDFSRNSLLCCLLKREMTKVFRKRKIIIIINIARISLRRAILNVNDYGWSFIWVFYVSRYCEIIFLLLVFLMCPENWNLFHMVLKYVKFAAPRGFYD